MNTLLRTLTTLALLTLVYGCMPRQEELDPKSVTDLANLKVADAFAFRSTRDILLNVKIASPAFAGEKYRINVYDDFPTVGNRITSGLTDENQNLRIELRTPAPLQYLYVEKVDPFGASEVLKIAAADYASVDFKKATPTLSMRTAASSGLDCATGTTRVFNNHTGNITLRSGDVVAITGTFRGDIALGDGSSLRICGTADIGSLSLRSNKSSVYFLEGSKVTVATIRTSANAKDPLAVVNNYSQALTFRGKTLWGGTIVNHGKITVEGELSMNGNCVFTNNGELTVTEDFNNNNVLTNNHSILVKGSFTAHGGSENLNICKLIIEKVMRLNNSLTNRGYIKAAELTTILGGATLIQGNGAMLSTKEVELLGSISGPSQGSAVVKVTGNSTFRGGAGMSGVLAYCDANGVETNQSKIASSYLSCMGTFLPTSPCNPEGFGTPVIKDTDADGASDAQDDFPTNANVVFTGGNYPSETGYATYGFEDLWPATGDYDFNDLVLNTRVTKELNGANKVVAMRFSLKVRAVGATFDNGFGIQLDDVASGDVASVTGTHLTKGLVNLNANGTESGQVKAVIIAFDTPEPLLTRRGGSGFNVIKGNPLGTSKEMEVVVKFRSPIEQSKLGQTKINVFIFANGKRDQEIHLANFAPTAKANGSLFGTLHDASNPAQGRYYRTANGLPWGLEIPADFEYPVEGAPITNAYRNFGRWAASGGKQYQDWYVKRSGQCSLDLIF